MVRDPVTTERRLVNVSRGMLAGAVTAGLFGVVWAESAAAAVSGPAPAAIRAVAGAAALVIVLWSARLWRSAAADIAPGAWARPMFSSPRYAAIVALQILAFGGGNALLGAIGGREYVVAWVAAVIGLHFVAFGRLFWPGFSWLGAALLTASAAGAAVGLAGGGADGIEATTGLIAAASLLIAGGWTVAGAAATAGTHKISPSS
jgi:hypothetical protein